MMYVKSLETNQVYKVATMPQYGGYVVATEEEYNEYCIKYFGKII